MDTKQAALATMHNTYDKVKQLNENLFFVCLGDLWGIYSIPQEKLVLEISYLTLEKTRKKDLLKITNRFHWHGYFSISQEKIVVPVRFDCVDFLDEGSGLTDDDKFLIFNTEVCLHGLYSVAAQKMVLETEYKEIKLIPGDRILVKQNNKFGVLSLDNFEELLPIVHDGFGPRIDCDLVIVKRDIRYGVYCLMEKRYVISLMYKEITADKKTFIIMGFDGSKTTVNVKQVRIANI